MTTPATCATGLVLEAIGLDAGVQPLVEWQEPGAVEDVTIELIGTVQAGQPNGATPLTSMALPAGTAAGDVLVLSAAGAVFTVDVRCDDPRMTSYSRDLDFGRKEMVAWGVHDGVSGDLELFCQDLANDSVAHLAVYRLTAGEVTGVTVSDSGAFNPCAPDMPFAADAVILGLAVHATNEALDTLGNFTRDGGSYAASASCDAYSYTAPGALPALFKIGAADINRWMAITLAVTTADVVVEGWHPNPDRSHALVSYSSSYGRSDSKGRVPPAQITVKAALQLSVPPTLGDRFRIALTADAATALDLETEQAARFTGEVTDVEVDPVARIWTAIGVGTLPRRARTTLDLTGAGSQTPALRVANVLIAIGVDDVGTLDVGGPTLAAPAAVTAATTILDAVTDSTLGQVVQQLDGSIDFVGPDHRRGRASVLTLTAHAITSAIKWAQHVGSTLNDAIVNYAGGQVEVIDHTSRDRRGPYPVTITTALETADDANALGTLIVGRYSTPAWDLPILDVRPGRTVVDVDKLAALYTLRHGDRITVPDLPAGGPVVGDFDFYVEGFTEAASSSTWRIGLAVSDPALSGVSIRWLDVDPDLRWIDVYPEIRWLDVARIEDADLLGIPGYSLDGGSVGAAPTRTIDGGLVGAGAPTRTIDGGSP